MRVGRRMRRLTRVAAVLALGAVHGGCVSMDGFYEQIESSLAAGRIEQAVERVEASREKVYGDRNRLLYDLDCGLLLAVAGRRDEAVACFERAKDTLDELYTSSLTAEAGSFMINDLTLPYGGEDFEAAQVHYFEARCYASEGAREEALVEARQTDVLLDRLNARYDEHKNAYREDAFLRYFSGLLWEAGGDPNDAFIAYEKAWKAYTGSYAEAGYEATPPAGLRDDLLRLSAALEIREDEWREALGDRAPGARESPATWGEIVLCHESGFAPCKVENRITVPMPDGYLLQVALPRYERRHPRLTRIELEEPEEGRVAQGELVQDLEGIAVRNLEDRMLRVTAKAIARATAKYVAAKAAQKVTEKKTGDAKKGRGMFQLMNAINVATEHADTRSWRLLPARIHMVRLRLPSGDHEVIARARGSGPAKERVFSSVRVPAGGKVFLFWRTFS